MPLLATCRYSVPSNPILLSSILPRAKNGRERNLAMYVIDSVSKKLGSREYNVGKTQDSAAIAFYMR